MKIHGPAWVVATCLSLLGAGCDDGEAREATTPIRDAPTTGVADDGSTVIFGGPRSDRSATVQGRRSSDYDEARLIREPNVPDPEQGDFTLEEAVVGLPIDGTLVAEIGTEFGTMLCDLYADRAPNTVANFIGLARGLRPFWDARAGEWVRRPYYRGLIFHRVIPEYIVQAGDYLGDGTGTVGYTIDDEPHDTLVLERQGQLAMANHSGPNTAGAQFFITDGPAPQLDGQGYTIFGDCRPAHIVSQIARVPQDSEAGNRPLTPIHITRMLIQRVEGGAAQASATPPRRPDGATEPRGASEPPHHRLDPRRYGEPSPLPGGRRGPPSPPRPVRGDPHQGHQH